MGIKLPKSGPIHVPRDAPQELIDELLGQMSGKKRKRRHRDWNAEFALAWQLHGGPQPTREHEFCEGRKFRFDFAWIDQKVAVEIDGALHGVWTKRGWHAGRHQTAKGFQGDAEKRNLAQQLGWVVLVYTGDDIKKRPLQVCEEVAQLLRSRT